MRKQDEQQSAIHEAFNTNPEFSIWWDIELEKHPDMRGVLGKWTVERESESNMFRLKRAVIIDLSQTAHSETYFFTEIGIVPTPYSIDVYWRLKVGRTWEEASDWLSFQRFISTIKGDYSDVLNEGLKRVDAEFQFCHWYLMEEIEDEMQKKLTQGKTP